MPKLLDKKQPKKASVKTPIDNGHSEYKVILQANNTEYKSSGATILDALANIPLTNITLKTKGTIFISRGTKSVEKFFQCRPLKLLLASYPIKKHWAKIFNVLLER